MTLVWDEIGSRTYESGVDRGVLYLPDGTGVVWNGLVSINEKNSKTKTPSYFDGRKIADLVQLGDYEAVIKAYTYPDEFSLLDGSVEFVNGVFLEDQPVKTFGLSYRSMIGNDVDSDAGYKIHVVYNLTAVPNDVEHATQSNDPDLIEFEWEVSAVPEDIPGYRPTAHLVIDSRSISPALLDTVEDILYGTESVPAELIPMDELLAIIQESIRTRVVDNGDGTWTATFYVESDLTFDPGDDTIFTIDNINGEFLDADTYNIRDTDA